MGSKAVPDLGTTEDGGEQRQVVISKYQLPQAERMRTFVRTERKMQIECCVVCVYVSVF